MAYVKKNTRFAMIPPVFKFRPSDEEKMEYLASKATGSQSLAYCDDLIGTVDLYGEREPWEIFASEGNEGCTELCLFTPLKKVAAGNTKKSPPQRISRNVGQGFWSNKGQRDAVYGRKGGVIGYKRCFRYDRKNKDDDDDDERVGKWLLKEYTLPDHMKGIVKEEYKDYALCVLKRKKEGTGRSGRNNNNNDCPPDVEIGFDDMMASILNCSTHEPMPVTVPVPEPDEEAWLQMIDWNELGYFNSTWNHDDEFGGDFTTRIQQPCSVEEELLGGAGGDENFFNHQSAP